MNNSGPSPTLAAIINDCLDQLLAQAHDGLVGLTDNALAQALRTGTLPGVEPGRAQLASALDAAADSRWVQALSFLRAALFYGVERPIVGAVFGLVILGLQDALPDDADLSAELLTVSNLTLLRALEVELNQPQLPLVGPENDIVVAEKRSLPELQEVFLGILGPEATASKGAMEQVVAELQGVATAPRSPAKDVADALAKLAAVAVAAGDFRSACANVSRALRLDPVGREVLVAGGFTWVCLVAAAHVQALADPACLPAATDLIATLQAALANEKAQISGARVAPEASQ